MAVLDVSAQIYNVASLTFVYVMPDTDTLLIYPLFKNYFSCLQIRYQRLGYCCTSSADSQTSRHGLPLVAAI
jgi:hypothetical protein